MTDKPAKRGRGRPASGTALSAAERQKRRREAAKERGERVSEMRLREATLQWLDDRAKHKNTHRGVIVDELVAAEQQREQRALDRQERKQLDREAEPLPASKRRNRL
ncbi:MAG: hypothetical protein ABW147_03155 [Candidatus Thiodiazotropha sp.]